MTNPGVFSQVWDDEKGRYLDTRHFVPGADEVRDIHLTRLGSSSPRQFGNAQVDIAHRFVYHSPDGFEWGYGGSGPADLALNILGLFVPPPEAWRLHHDYKDDVIARLSQDGPHTITAASVRDWIAARWKGEQANG